MVNFNRKVSREIGYAKFCNPSHDAVIRVYAGAAGPVQKNVRANQVANMSETKVATR
jgi:hypothetical protein